MAFPVSPFPGTALTGCYRLEKCLRARRVPCSSPERLQKQSLPPRSYSQRELEKKHTNVLE